MTLADAGIGALAGAGYGVVGYFKNRSGDDPALKQFKPQKFLTTVILSGMAGAAVGYMGDPLNAGNIDATTTALASVGVAESVNTGVKALFRYVRNARNK